MSEEKESKAEMIVRLGKERRARRNDQPREATRLLISKERAEMVQPKLARKTTEKKEAERLAKIEAEEKRIAKIEAGKKAAKVKAEAKPSTSAKKTAASKEVSKKKSTKKAAISRGRKKK